MTLLALVQTGGVLSAGWLVLVLVGLFRQHTSVKFCTRDCCGCDERCATRTGAHRPWFRVRDGAHRVRRWHLAPLRSGR